MNILIAEPIAQAAIDLLAAREGWTVTVSNPRDFRQHLAEAEALVVRSAVRVTADVLSEAPKLRVIGRAGAAVDNVDLLAATAAGVLVMNTPGANAVSVAEHTLGLMLSMARSIPQANASTKAGNWEYRKFLGSELRGKTLGVIGLGSIGREVVKRARAFEMRVIAHDPYVTPQLAKDAGVELTTAAELYRQSDYISLHVSLTLETDRLLNRDAFAQMKQGVRIVNCARGELVDEAALKEAMEAGKVAGAALDVFAEEPAGPSCPLFALDSLLATPHIGGATEEAQEQVGIRIAQQMAEYLQSGVAVHAVNIPSLSTEQYRAAAPFIDLTEKLGILAAHLASGNPKMARLTWFGRVSDMNTILLRNAGLAGALNRSTSARKANVVNAMQLAADRGWNVAEVHDKSLGHADSVRFELETDSGITALEGAVVQGKARLINVDDIYCEAPLNGPLVCVKSLDVPGVVGHMGTVLGANRINIANFSLGRRERNEPYEALSIISTDSLVPQAVLDELLSNPAVKLARAVAIS
ncbi:MAG: phosphoglycerate dehydrogenase [Acidobacteriota bacterium]